MEVLRNYHRSYSIDLYRNLDVTRKSENVEDEPRLRNIPVFYTTSPGRRFLQLLPKLLGLVVTLRIVSDYFEYKRNFSSLRIKMDANAKYENKRGKNLDDLKVSVIVPTRNEADTLARLLTSLSSQTYSNIQVVVVDYQSHDRTEEIARNFGSKFVSVNKQGIGLASNAGVLESDGEIIIRADSDSWFPPDFIERIVGVFSSYPEAKLVVASHYYYDGSTLENLVAHLYDKYWRPSYATPGFMTAIFRQTFNEIGGYDSKLIMGEDYDLGFRLAKKFGSDIIHHDRNLLMMISARALRKQGILRRLIKGHKSYSPTACP